MNDRGFSFRKRILGFKYAFRGFRLLMRHEHNAWLHCIIAACAIVAGLLLNISAMEWVAIVIVSGCVFAAEAINTAVERLSDVVSPEYNDAIKDVKDLSAGGVFFMAITAVITGIIIFLPKILPVI